MTDHVRSEGHPARYVDGASTQVQESMGCRARRPAGHHHGGGGRRPGRSTPSTPCRVTPGAGRWCFGSSHRPMARLTDTSGAIERALGGQRLPVAHDGRPEGRSGAPLVRFALLAGFGAIVSVVVLLFVIIPAMGGWAARANAAGLGAGAGPADRRHGARPARPQPATRVPARSSVPGRRGRRRSIDWRDSWSGRSRPICRFRCGCSTSASRTRSPFRAGGSTCSAACWS